MKVAVLIMSFLFMTWGLWISLTVSNDFLKSLPAGANLLPFLTDGWCVTNQSETFVRTSCDDIALSFI